MLFLSTIPQQNILLSLARSLLIVYLINMCIQTPFIHKIAELFTGYVTPGDESTVSKPDCLVNYGTRGTKSSIVGHMSPRSIIR